MAGKSVETLTADLAEPSTIRCGADAEGILAEVLADVVRVERVPVDSHFFDDLGADSLVMAHFCARVRKRADVPSVSMKDVYQHPTIASLAAALAPPGDTLVEPAQPPVEVGPPASTRQYVLCGTLQVLLLLGYVCLVALGLDQAIQWVAASGNLLADYLRTVVVGGVTFLAACTLPIAAKWVLVGRWKRRRIRVWSLDYVRFWLVKTLVTLNPVVLFAGSPLYVLYLRALGARVGRGAVVFSRHAPVCTDLLTIGDGTIIRKDTYLTGYRAHAGWIETGAVTVGRDAFVGEKAVLDIETSIGDGAQLGHVSSLHTGQHIPHGQRWHGSPAQPTEANYQTAAPADCGIGRRAVYTAVQLASLLLLYLPLMLSATDLLFGEVPGLATLFDSDSTAFASWSFVGVVLVTSLVLFFGSVLLGLLLVVTLPRLLNLVIEPDKVYRLYGFRYAAHRAIAGLTNRKFFVELLGDSSYIVGYLRCLGYRLAPVVQTGANFGKQVKHETPYLVSVGSGTVVADGLSIANADYSSTSFRVSEASIGRNNFLGNDIVYPARGRTGDNCLLATKVLVPLDGEIREDVGLLGSPSFEIPRTVERDSRFQHMASGDELPGRLAAKNKHNALTIAWFLLSRWGYAFVITLTGFWAADLRGSWGGLAIASFAVFSLVFGVVYFALVERAATGFRGTQPSYCSIYQLDCWRRERFLKLTGHMHMALNGTPLKNVAWRLLGVRLGRRLLDDGCTMAEKDMVTIGDDCALNVGSSIQCHSLEDFAFKADRITIGSGCTIGVGALVHYGVTMGDGVVLAPDSFLMKGEEVPPHARWGGNPAREMPDTATGSPARRNDDHSADAALTGDK
ncbi:Pls/PosA family non-ribosomal peptide synthetase [Kutzneria kofuensis]|uniref:Non-ribosomal peptide synthetase-like protein n=1 Tax=Kutzneria kofuensis TaxID=103725 RepID=A0A7W9KST3_9PSEU|nr:Pls/PosA family non-ribosomal peptide synthetase [Kutzneria kofuensis]MBB5897987.1 non-ribosomal peptide synthetase-like protein [Kutzneria kofuensis]